MWKNNDPLQPWNDPIYKNDPLAPHNDPIYRDDVCKPWNNPFGSSRDLNDREAGSYGVYRRRNYYEEDY